MTFLENDYLGDSCSDEVKSKPSSAKKEEKGDDIISSLLCSLDADIDMDMMLGKKGKKSASNSKGGMESAGLSEFSKHTLREMCSQDWVREKFLRDPETLFTPEMLLDNMLSPEQTQQLVQMICYPVESRSQPDIGELSNKDIINKILKTLDMWTLRVSLWELNLMFKQATTNSENNTLLNNISQATINLFHQQTEHLSRTTNNSQAAAQLDTMPVQSPKPESSEQDNSVWMVAPLISKLPSGVQGQVLKQAGQVLESSNTFLGPKSKLDKERNQRSKSLLSHQPFLSLILTCLKGQDEQREGLLNSLLTQLEKFIHNFREMLEKYPDEAKIRNNIHETLQLRLSLVGGMFDTIQRNLGMTTEWSQLLLQLISSGVVDIQSNYELFTTVLDMLNCLILGTLVPDPTEKNDDTKKIHGNLVKKLRKELGDKHFEATDMIRHLLPLPKRYYEVITVEPHGTLVDTKGNKIQGFDSIRRKQGLQVGKMELVSPWDVIEGFKNPPPLSWTYFGAVRIEKKPLKYEEQHRLMLHHSHCMTKPVTYYLDPPTLPPEELEPPPEKVPEEKPREVVESQTVDAGGKKQKTQRRRRTSRVTTTTYPTQPTIPRPYNGYHEPVYPQQNPSSNWYAPPPMQQQSQYMGQQPMPPGMGPRYPAQNASKQAIQSMLRARQPGTGGVYPQQAIQNLQMMQKQRQNQMVRHRLQQQFHQQNPQNRLAETQGLYGNSVPGTNQPSGMMPISQSPMNQTYQSNYGGMQSQPIESMGGGMMSQSYNQSYPSTQNPSMMPNMPPQQTGYMSQPGQPSQQPYNAPTSRLQMTSGGMQNPSTLSSMGSYSQMGPTPSGPQGGGGMTQRILTPQHQQRLQQMRQQMLLQQQQQKQQMHSSSQQQQAAALVAQLQRQMPGPGGHPGQPNPPQYNTYNQPPQY